MYPKNDISWDLDKYLGAFNFRVTIDGIAQESMKVVGVSNVVSESEIVEYKLGHEPYIRKIPGRSKFSEVEITRIYQGYDQMYSWRAKIEDGFETLKNVKVEILAPDLNTVVLQMILHNCWPLRWQLPNLDASSTAPATETITLACERVTQSVASPKSVSSSIDIVNSNPAQIPTADSFLAPTGGTEEQVFRDNDTTVFQGEAEQDFRDNDLTKYQGEGEQDFRDNDLTKFVGDGKNRFTFSDQADELAAMLGEGPLDPNEETWDPPTPGDDEKDFRDNDDTKFQGEGEQDFRDNDDTKFEGDGENRFTTAAEGAANAAASNAGAIDPNEETWDAPESNFEDVTAAKQGGDGTGPIIKGNASGAKQEFSDTGGGEGPIGGRGDQEGEGIDGGDGPLDPNEESWDGPEGVDDPTAGRNGGDGDGPLDPNDESWGAPEAGDDSKDFRDNDLTKFQGEGEQDFRDSATGINAADDPTAGNNGGDGTGPIDPNEESWGAPDAVDDPTAGRNGGDGSGPIGGRGAQAAADGGDGDGPIENEAQDWGGSAAADDPTAARNGGDGSGPVGGRGAAAEADYGAPGSGPIGGRGAQETPE